VGRAFVALWNSRGDTVGRSDMLESDPIRIELGEAEIVLDARVIGES
jgi:hypothetical protein